MDTTPTTQEGLVRVMGVRALSLGIINMIIGAGIYVLPGRIAELLGPSAILAYFLCSVAVALVFLCYAEAGSRVTRSGGTYAYIEDAFGPFVGFLSSVLLWFGWGILSNAAVAIAFAELVGFAFPVMNGVWHRSVLLIGVFSLLTWVNIRGASWGVRFTVINTWAKLVPLVVLAFGGAFFVEWEHLRITEWPSLSSLGTGTLMLVFAFGGGELALNAGGEVKDPGRTVPWALLWGILTVFLVYLGIQGVAQGVMGPDLLNNMEAPLVATAERAWGPWGRVFMLIGAGISIFGVTSGHVLNHPRAVFAAARDGLLPGVLARVHPRYHTPHVAVVFSAGLACAFALTGTFKTLAIVSSGSLLLLYLGCSLAVLRLRRMPSVSKGPVFRIPFGPVVPVASCLVIGWLLLNMTRAEVIGLSLLLAVSAVAYVLMRRAR
jgi:APA family basic amino acid/polyamine antiporter